MGSSPGSSFSLSMFLFLSPHLAHDWLSFLQVYSCINSKHPLVCSTNSRHNGTVLIHSFSFLTSVSDLTTFYIHIRPLECVSFQHPQSPETHQRASTIHESLSYFATAHLHCVLTSASANALIYDFCSVTHNHFHTETCYQHMLSHWKQFCLINKSHAEHWRLSWASDFPSTL